MKAAADQHRAAFLQGFEQFKAAGLPENPYISSSANSDAFNLGVFAAAWNLAKTVTLQKSRGYNWIMGGELYRVEGAIVAKLAKEDLWSVADCCPAGFTLLEFPSTVQIQKDGRKVADMPKPHQKQTRDWWTREIRAAIVETCPARRCAGCGATERIIGEGLCEGCNRLAGIFTGRSWSHIHAENPPI